MPRRYIYIPVGGSKNALLATALVFTFVALWHDLSLQLLTWGWAVSLFVVPEMLCRKLFTAEKVSLLAPALLRGLKEDRSMAATGGIAISVPLAELPTSGC